MRYFRSSPATYEQVRSQLDAAWGYPNEATKTETAIPPAAELPSDSVGRVYLAIQNEYCEYILPSELLPQLLGSGAVEEVAEGVYVALLPSSPYG